MAILPTSGSISVSQINTLKALGSVSTSLTTRELQYMGGNPANAGTSQVCFPNQVERVSSTNWTYNGATAAWRPTRMSEFLGAYNGVPAVAVSKSVVGNRLRANFRADCSGSSVGGTYFVFGTGTGITHSNLNAWVACTPTSFTWSNATVTSGTVTFRAYVRDSQNCGTMNEFTSTVNYP